MQLEDGSWVHEVEYGPEPSAQWLSGTAWIVYDPRFVRPIDPEPPVE